MKTRVNGIPQIQAPCPWRRFGRSSEKDKWRNDILHDDIIQHFNSELEQRRFKPDSPQPKVRFRILGRYSAEQYDAQIFGQSVLLRLLVTQIWVSWHIKKKIKVSPPTDVRRMSLLELPIKRRKKRRCCAKIKKKEYVRAAPYPNANSNGSKGCQKLCIGFKIKLKQGH